MVSSAFLFVGGVRLLRGKARCHPWSESITSLIEPSRLGNVFYDRHVGLLMHEKEISRLKTDSSHMSAILVGTCRLNGESSSTVLTTYSSYASFSEGSM